jgi:hypothetical protein
MKNYYNLKYYSVINKLKILLQSISHNIVILVTLTGPYAVEIKALLVEFTSSVKNQDQQPFIFYFLLAKI